MDGDPAAAAQARIEEALDRLSVAVANVHHDLRSHMMAAERAMFPPASAAPDLEDAREPRLPHPEWEREVDKGSAAMPEEGGTHATTGIADTMDAQQSSVSAGMGGLAMARRRSFQDMLRAGSVPGTGMNGSPSRGRLRAGHLSSLGLPAEWPSSLRKHAFLEDAVNEDEELDGLPSAQRSFSSSSTEALPVYIPEQQTIKITGADKINFVQGVLALIGFAVLSHDLCITPFALAWQLEFAGYLEWTTVVSVVFWTVDLLCSIFLGGSCRRHSFQPTISPTGKAYLRSWFILDVLLICGDLLYIIIETSGSERATEGQSLRLLRFAKVARLLRVVGLLRALHIFHRLREAFERSFSEFVKAAVSVGSVLAGILWTTHALACIWFAIGQWAESDSGNHWLDQTMFHEDRLYRDASILFQYLTSAHWALQQIVMAGSTDVPCTNAVERVCNIACLMLGFMVGSLLISSLSATMVDFRTRQQERERTLSGLRQYLRSSAVPFELGGRVLAQVADRLTAQETVGQETVPGLDLLSNRLRVELHAHTCAPWLVTHPLFRLWAAMDPNWFTRVCWEAVKIEFLRGGDDLFSIGTPAVTAHVLMTGKVMYSEGQTRSRALPGEVLPGAWLCESALWSEWVHVGTATAALPCRLLTLNSANFLKVCRGHRVVMSLASAYCREFHRRIVSAKPPVARFPNDLLVPGTDFADIVSSMPKGARILIGMHAVRNYSLSQAYEGVNLISLGRRKVLGGQDKLKDKLLKEVTEGTSIVVVDGAGKLARVVSLLVLKIEDNRGRILVQLGKQEDGDVVANCELPGAKLQEEEVAESALERILMSKLRPIAGIVELTHIEVTSSEKFSSAYGLQTKYLHTVCRAALVADFDHPVCTFAPDNFGKVRSGRSESQGEFDLKSLATILPSSVLTGPIYMFRYQGKGGYYAWLPSEDMEMLGKPAGKAALLELLSRLECPGAEPLGKADTEDQVVRGAEPLATADYEDHVVRGVTDEWPDEVRSQPTGPVNSAPPALAFV